MHPTNVGISHQINQDIFFRSITQSLKHTPTLILVALVTNQKNLKHYISIKRQVLNIIILFSSNTS